MAQIVTLVDQSGDEIQFLIDDEQSSAPRDVQTKGTLQAAGSNAEATERSFSAYFDPVRRLADQLAAKIAEIETKPSEVEVTLGIKLTSGLGVIFAKADAEAEMTVKLVWKDGSGV